MKKLIVSLLIAVFGLTAVSCEKEDALPQMQPEAARMKSICELAVMECYYHNVAKFQEEDAEGFLWWQKDKRFWIEYSGVVRLGIDASLVNIQVNENQVVIEIPEARVMDCKVDSASLNEDSYIVDVDSAKISAEDEVRAFNEAQHQLEQNAANDRALLAEAQQRTQSLLEDYVHNIGNIIGVDYSIQWVYLESDDANPVESSLEELPSENSEEDNSSSS